MKTELLEENYLKSARVPHRRDPVPRESKLLIPLIERHLRRIAPQGPGLTLEPVS